jgi:hypothetical protein
MSENSQDGHTPRFNSFQNLLNQVGITSSETQELDDMQQEIINIFGTAVEGNLYPDDFQEDDMPPLEDEADISESDNEVNMESSAEETSTLSNSINSISNIHFSITPLDGIQNTPEISASNSDLTSGDAATISNSRSRINFLLNTLNQLQSNDVFDIVQPIGGFDSIYNIRNPSSSRVYEPNYLIENYKENELSICEIDYPYNGSLVKLFVPTIIVLDQPYFNRLLFSQIINFKDILNEKETALEIAYFIKTGEITPEVQPHHDELSGYSKQPISEDELKEIYFKNIKDTEVIDTIDDSSLCTLSQVPIKELLDEGEEIVVLECGHYFCKDLIYTHLSQYGNKCPNCNKVLSKNEPKNETELTREEILGNNYYKAAYFIIRYCNYYRQFQSIDIQRLNQINQLFINNNGTIPMRECEQIINTVNI